MIIRRRGETIRSGIAKSRTIRSGKTKSRNTGSKITGRIRISRSGKNKSRNTGSKITGRITCSNVTCLQCLAPTLALSQNAIMILLFVWFFFQISMFLMLLL